MNSMVTIKESKNISVDSKVINFLNPDYIYLPMEDGFAINVKSNTNVYKEDILLKSDEKFVYSPISGTVLGKTSSMSYNNEPISCVVVENDFREKLKHKKSTEKYINEYSLEEALNLIKKYNACDNIINSTSKTLLINGVDSDPFEKTYAHIIDSYSSKILEAIDALSIILGVDTTILAVNNHDTNNVINLSNNIGTYPNITLKLVPDIYPLSFQDILIKNILTKKQINAGITYLTVEDVYNIYNVLKRKKPITEKLVTISGDAIESPVVVNVKIGTSLTDLIKNCCHIINKNYYVVINGLISGKTLTSLNNIITSKTRSVFLNTLDTTTEKKCINCGLCNKKCPVGLNPKYIKEHKNADSSKCINCGLCTYICPSKINFKPYLGGNNEE